LGLEAHDGRCRGGAEDKAEVAKSTGQGGRLNDSRGNKDSRAESKQALCIKPLGQKKAKGGNLQRSVVSITSYRCRLLDPDNLCVKYHIDAIRLAEIIKDDTAEDIEIILRQVKTKTRKEEKTIIEVE